MALFGSSPFRGRPIDDIILESRKKRCRNQKHLPVVLPQEESDAGT